MTKFGHISGYVRGNETICRETAILARPYIFSFYKVAVCDLVLLSANPSPSKNDAQLTRLL